MKYNEEKLARYDALLEKINFLTEEIVKNPLDRALKKELKRAEDELCKKIQEDQKEIDKLIESFNQSEEWEE